MVSNYDLLCADKVKNLDDILLTIKEAKELCGERSEWKLMNSQELAEKIEYHYGDGKSGLIQALYNTLIGAIMHKE